MGICETTNNTNKVEENKANTKTKAVNNSSTNEKLEINNLLSNEQNKINNDRMPECIIKFSPLKN